VVPDNVATFANNGAATTVTIFVAGPLTINTIQFAPGAPSYLFQLPFPTNFNINGNGIINNSPSAPTFLNASDLSFNNASTAGKAIITNGFRTTFHAASTAGNSTIENGRFLNFVDSSTAGSAFITNIDTLSFANTSSAGNATIINNTFGVSALTNFVDQSTAGNATIITNAGSVTSFRGSSSGGNARFITNAGGTYDISGLTSGGTTAGSIEGAGNYFLGSKTLSVGGNNLSTEVSGVIQDGARLAGAEAQS
jgi:hypothetical protein